MINFFSFGDSSGQWIWSILEILFLALPFCAVIYQIIQDARARKDSTAPNFILTYHKVKDEGPNYHFRLRNVGSGPAYNVRISVSTSKTTFRGVLKGDVDTFGPNPDEKTILILENAGKAGGNAFMADHESAEIIVTALDMYQRKSIHVYTVQRIDENGFDNINPKVSINFLKRDTNTK